MQYKLLLENWKKYLSEQQSVMTGPDGESLGGDDYWVTYKKSLNPQARKDIEDMEAGCNSGEVPGYCRQIEIHKRTALEQNRRRNASDTNSGAIDTARVIVKTIFLMLDPTGQVGDVDFNTGEVTSSLTLLKRDVASFEKNPNLLGAGQVALGSLAMIPIVGKLGKLGKLGKAGTGAAQAKRKKTILQNASEISKEMKKSGDPKLIAKSKEIDNAIQKIKIPQASRLRSYISGIQKQINQKVLSAIRKGSFKVGQTRTYKVPKPKDSKLELDEVSVEILPMKSEEMLRGNRKVVSGADYGADALGSGKGVGGDIDIKIYVHPRFIKDGVVDKQALREVHKELNKTGFHEMIHARQAKRNLKGSKAPEDQFASAEKIQNQSYRDYRLDPQEIAAHAQDAAVSIGKVSKTGLDTLDLMAQRIRAEFSSFDDLVRFNSPVHIETIKAQLAYAAKNIPCAAISAANVFELEALGIFDASKLSQKNQNIINTGSRKKSIVVSPKNCARKLMERIIQEELRAVLKEKGSFHSL